MPAKSWLAVTRFDGEAPNQTHCWSLSQALEELTTVTTKDYALAGFTRIPSGTRNEEQHDKVTPEMLERMEEGEIITAFHTPCPSRKNPPFAAVTVAVKAIEWR